MAGWSGAIPVLTSPNGCGFLSKISTLQLMIFFKSNLAIEKPAGPEPTIANLIIKMVIIWNRLNQ